MSDFGLEINYKNSHVKFKNDVIEKAVKSVPSAFKLYDSKKKKQIILLRMKYILHLVRLQQIF